MDLSSDSLHQSRDDFAFVRRRSDRAEFGAELVGGVEAKAGEQRGEEIGDGDFVADDFQTSFIRLTNHNSALDRAASEYDRGDVWKMIAAIVGVDLWCSTELAHPDDERFVPQAVRLKIIKQRTPRSIDLAAKAGDGAEVVGMRIPSVVLDFNEPHAGFQKPSSQQTASSKVAFTVATSIRLSRAVDIECFHKRSRHHSLNLLQRRAASIEAGVQMAFIELRAELCEELHRPSLSAQAGNQLHRRGWVFDSERCMVRAHVRWAEPCASD